MDSLRPSFARRPRHPMAAALQMSARAVLALRSGARPCDVPTASISLCGFTALLSAAVRNA